MMISASHNPHFDNGIKLFGPDGFKLPDEAEDAISKIISGHIPLAEPEKLGRARRMQMVWGGMLKRLNLPCRGRCVLKA